MAREGLGPSARTRTRVDYNICNFANVIFTDLLPDLYNCGAGNFEPIASKSTPNDSYRLTECALSWYWEVGTSTPVPSLPGILLLSHETVSAHSAIRLEVRRLRDKKGHNSNLRGYLLVYFAFEEYMEDNG